MLNTHTVPVPSRAARKQNGAKKPNVFHAVSGENDLFVCGGNWRKHLWLKTEMTEEADCIIDCPPSSTGRDVERLRRIAFVGVAISAVTTICAALLIPILHGHVQYVQSLMQSEVEYCKTRSSNILREITRTEVTCSKLSEVSQEFTSLI